MIIKTLGQIYCNNISQPHTSVIIITLRHLLSSVIASCYQEGQIHYRDHYQTEEQILYIDHLPTRHLTCQNIIHRRRRHRLIPLLIILSQLQPRRTRRHSSYYSDLSRLMIGERSTLYSYQKQQDRRRFNI